MPPLAGDAFVICGFCWLEVNPFGPVQLYDAPGRKVAERLTVAPSQTGPVLPATTLFRVGSQMSVCFRLVIETSSTPKPPYEVPAPLTSPPRRHRNWTVWPEAEGTVAALVTFQVVPVAVPVQATVEAAIGLQKLLAVVAACVGVVKPRFVHVPAFSRYWTIAPSNVASVR